MKTRNGSNRRARWLGAALLFGLWLGCKDEDPCDPGQVLRRANACYTPTPDPPGPDEMPDAGAGDSGPSGAGGFAIGQPCADTTGSSDCGGAAPICAPLPAGAACTQILCLDGEANAGICPAAWPCTELPGYPSTCLEL